MDKKSIILKVKISQVKNKGSWLWRPYQWFVKHVADNCCGNWHGETMYIYDELQYVISDMEIAINE